MKTRRMFSGDITECDGFVNMPSSAQALYLHLCMNADDEGFIAKASLAMFESHATTDDLSILITRRFVYKIDQDYKCVYLIKHWWANNFIRKSRRTISAFTDARRLVYVKDDGNYTLDSSEGSSLDGCVQVAYKCRTNVVPVNQIKSNQIKSNQSKTKETNSTVVSSVVGDKPLINLCADCTSEINKLLKHGYITEAEMDDQSVCNDYEGLFGELAESYEVSNIDMSLKYFLGKYTKSGKVADSVRNKLPLLRKSMEENCSGFAESQGSSLANPFSDVKDEELGALVEEMKGNEKHGI